MKGGYHWRPCLEFDYKKQDHVDNKISMITDKTITFFENNKQADPDKNAKKCKTKKSWQKNNLYPKVRN